MFFLDYTDYIIFCSTDTFEVFAKYVGELKSIQLHLTGTDGWNVLKVLYAVPRNLSFLSGRGACLWGVQNINEITMV